MHISPVKNGKIACARLLLLLAALLTLHGCINNGFNIRNLAKSDVDMVTDTHIRELVGLTQELAVKLYRRNPVQLQRGHLTTLEKRLLQLSDNRNNFRFAELNNRVGNDALLLAFADDYTGDRVFAVMVGLKSMLHAAYNHKPELFLLDELDHQKLYNSARNLEIINWRLNNLRDSQGELFLLSNGVEDGVQNLSFERLFGKMIVLQDMMAKIVADRNNRAINTVVHSVASTALLPIGL